MMALLAARPGIMLAGSLISGLTGLFAGPPKQNIFNFISITFQ